MEILKETNRNKFVNQSIKKKFKNKHRNLERHYIGYYKSLGKLQQRRNLKLFVILGNKYKNWDDIDTEQLYGHYIRKHTFKYIKKTIYNWYEGCHFNRQKRTHYEAGGQATIAV